MKGPKAFRSLWQEVGHHVLAHHWGHADTQLHFSARGTHIILAGGSTGYIWGGFDLDPMHTVWCLEPHDMTTSLHNSIHAWCARCLPVLSVFA
jgi:hypothetical protein